MIKVFPNRDRSKDCTIKNELDNSFKKLSIEQNTKKSPPDKTTQTKKFNFQYEPCMFPAYLVKEATGGIPWHNLSPNSRT